ncbi:glycosyl hydrolase family 28-related protein [Streptomyces sp. NPDC021080]|uniref:glycosyl hydrolase family 28-related protein n=1 Tax=Streptomyces sp. NPDC021080 TaxID=3365110 RepID=UPI003788E65C
MVGSIPTGTANWDVPLNAALVDLQTQATTLARVSVIVKDPAYGATGNGTTDDTAAIQAAISAVGAAGGGVVYFPPGNYLLNGSSPLTVSSNSVVLRGSGAEATKILVGSGFSGSSAISVTGTNVQITDLSVNGNSATTTTNPTSHGITVSGARRLRVYGCQFWYLNGYAIRALATSSSSTTNPHGTQISNIRVNQCAGGIHFLGHTAQGFAVNSFVSDVHIQQGGVTTGANANLDGVRIEDAWDVLTENVISWLQAGTGSAFHVYGTCAASFNKNLDALGPTTAPNILVEDGPNGSPQNVQFNGGVIQQGSVGIKVSGGSQHVHFDTVRVINNQGHGAQVDGTGLGINFHKCFFSQSGQAATGTNYDINWSGAATGQIIHCRFSSPIVSTGTAGVQQTVNVATVGQNVRIFNADFQGTGSATTNWVTNLPSILTEISSSKNNFATTATFSNGTRPAEFQPSASTNTALSGNVNGTDAFDRWRINGKGDINLGSGSANRDTTWGRIGTAQIGSSDSDIIVGLAGKGLRVKEGSNAKMGTATLVAGTVTVANTSVTSTSRIIAFSQADGGTPGWLRCSTRVVGTSFTITSSSGSDTSTIMWIIYEPAP